MVICKLKAYLCKQNRTQHNLKNTDKEMLSEILKILPMLVCLFWGIAIFITLCERRKRHYGVLTLFMANATLLYWGLSIYYNRIALLIPVSDTVYTFCNLAIYPLFLCYIKAVKGRYAKPVQPHSSDVASP